MKVFMSSSKFERPKICTVPDCGRKPMGHGLCAKHYKRARMAGTLPKRELITLGEKIQRCVIVNPVTNCWEWRRQLDKLGYARISFTGAASRLAHRISFAEFVGPIPEGLDVCHRCDNRKCCNPAHLFLATHQENMADRDAKGRGKMPQPTTKLTPEQVRIIRNSSISSMVLGRKFRVDRHTISRARSGRTHRDV